MGGGGRPGSASWREGRGVSGTGGRARGGLGVYTWSGVPEVLYEEALGSLGKAQGREVFPRLQDLDAQEAVKPVTGGDGGSGDSACAGRSPRVPLGRKL